MWSEAWRHGKWVGGGQVIGKRCGGPPPPPRPPPPTPHPHPHTHTPTHPHIAGGGDGHRGGALRFHGSSGPHRGALCAHAPAAGERRRGRRVRPSGAMRHPACQRLRARFLQPPYLWKECLRTMRLHTFLFFCCQKLLAFGQQPRLLCALSACVCPVTPSARIYVPICVPILCVPCPADNTRSCCLRTTC